MITRKKLDYTCNIDPINYDYAAQDTMKHLYFKDYKHLKGVEFTDDNKINWFEVLTLLIAFASITLVLFLSEV